MNINKYSAFKYINSYTCILISSFYNPLILKRKKYPKRTEAEVAWGEKGNGKVITVWGSGVRKCLEPWLYKSQALSSQTSYLKYPNFNLPVGNMKIVKSLPHWVSVRINAISHIKCIIQCMAHSKYSINISYFRDKKIYLRRY